MESKLPLEMRKKILTDWTLLKKYRELVVESDQIFMKTAKMLSEKNENESKLKQLLRRIHNFVEYRKYLLNARRYEDLEQTNMKKLHLNTVIFDTIEKIERARRLIRSERRQQVYLLCRMNKFPDKYKWTSVN